MILKTLNFLGKSTLLNCLTGHISPSRGNGTICDMKITEEMDEIRHLLGFVPQYDILWDELTVLEHMEMFCKLKRIDEIHIPSYIHHKLKEVSLHDCKNVRAKQLSGGMKRRLSVILGSIGDPKVILMDEPTTG